MSLEKDKKLYITAGIVLILILILSALTFGLLITDKYENKVSTASTQVIPQSGNYLSTQDATKENLPKLPQSMKEQYKTPGAVFNNYNIEIHNQYSYSYPKYKKYPKYGYYYNSGPKYYQSYNPYYKPYYYPKNYKNYKSYGNKYYNNQYSYGKHSYYYQSKYY